MTRKCNYTCSCRVSQCTQTMASKRFPEMAAAPSVSQSAHSGVNVLTEHSCTKTTAKIQ